MFIMDIAIEMKTYKIKMQENNLKTKFAFYFESELKPDTWQNKKSTDSPSHSATK